MQHSQLTNIISTIKKIKTYETKKLITPIRAVSYTHLVTVVVVEQGTKEPVIGAVVRAEGATTPRVTGIDGECTLTLSLIHI